jgi:uncharacterized protein
MTPPPSPSEVFLALVNGVAEGRYEELPDLYAEQTDVIHPFDPMRRPALRSREELRAHFGAGGGRARPRRRVGNVIIHQTTDPEVIVAEFEYQGTADGSGEQVTVPGIFVLRVRDGEIVSSRDYFDHLTAARAQGRLDELIAALR